MLVINKTLQLAETYGEANNTIIHFLKNTHPLVCRSLQGNYRLLFFFEKQSDN